MADVITDVLNKPGLLRRVLEAAIDAAWCAIESASCNELEGDLEWMDLGKYMEIYADDVALLTDLGLLGIHPEHPTWVREIAEL